MVYLFYTTYISVDLAHHEIVCAKVGTGRISTNLTLVCCLSYCFILDTHLCYVQ